MIQYNCQEDAKLASYKTDISYDTGVLISYLCWMPKII